MREERERGWAGRVLCVCESVRRGAWPPPPAARGDLVAAGGRSSRMSGQEDWAHSSTRSRKSVSRFFSSRPRHEYDTSPA